MSKDLVYKIADADTADQQADLFNRVFNQCATVASWKRKYVNNPLSGKYMVMCAFDGDRVVGVNGFIPMDYTFQGECIHVVQSCDTAVDPEYRGQGIFNKMISAAQEYFKEEGYDAIVGYPNINSFHGFIKLGWTEVNRTMKYFYPNNVSNVARDMLGKNVPAFFDPVASIWRGLHFFPLLTFKRGYTIEVQRTITVYDYIAFLNISKIHILLSQEYLDWKLSADHCLYIVKKNGVIACKLLICDYYVDERYRRGNILGVSYGELGNGDFLAGFAMILKSIRNNYDILSVWESNDPRITSAYKKLGFIQNFSEKKGSPLLVKVLTTDCRKNDILSNSTNWSPCFIEADYVLDNHIVEGKDNG